jgi:hypothetical protein
MNPSHESDADLERRLRRAMAPVDDAGFSARVVAALPASAAKRRNGRILFAAIGAVAGIAVALAALRDTPLPSAGDAVQDLVDALRPVSNALFQPAGLLALAVTAFSLAVAFWPSLRPRRDD